MGPMDAAIRSHLDDLHSKDKNVQGAAYAELLKLTAEPVEWAYEAWDEVVEGLSAKDNRLRSIAAQLLANLAKGDPKGRILRDFGKLLAVTKDQKFVTARHAVQSIWRVGLASKKQRKVLLEGLSRRFAECASEKNGTLTRYDIVEALHRLDAEVDDPSIRKTALALIETEPDLKYKKKYAKVWK